MDGALDPLLRPKSIAIIGASQRPESFGRIVLDGLVAGGYQGRIVPVHPSHADVAGIAAVPSLGEVAPVDCALLAVGNDRLEIALEDAAAAGAKAAVVFGSAQGSARGGGPLGRRLAEIAHGAGMALCGGNSMGFLNLTDRCYATGYPYRGDPTPGHITFISHSGSAFSALVNNRRDLRFNALISCGQELVTSAAGYIAWAIDQPETRAVGCFLETVRDGVHLRGALVAAAERGIPVVVLKVGRSETGSRLVETHSGALAGEHVAHEAGFSAYGAIVVRSLDEMVDTLDIAAADRRPTGRGLALATDSGGERALICDIAADHDIQWTDLAPATVARLREALDPELKPANPLDLWGSGVGFVESYVNCLIALAEDPGVDLLVFAIDLIPRSRLLEPYVDIALRVARRILTPFAVLANLAATADGDAARRLREAGVPVLLGTENGMAAIGHLLKLPQRQQRATQRMRHAPPDAQSPWLDILRGRPGQAFDEVESKAFLASAGVPTVPERVVHSAAEASRAATELGFPVVLKTAEPGIIHKVDRGGVVLGLRGGAAVAAAYRRLRQTCGPRVVVQPQVNLADAFEMYLGLTIDPQWGPILTVGFGGTDIESIRDVVNLIANTDTSEIEEALHRLRGYPLLLGTRSRSPVDLESLVRIINLFAEAAVRFGEEISSVDVNPLIVGPWGVMAVDATVITRQKGDEDPGPDYLSLGDG